MGTGTRQTAEQRRGDLIRAAMSEFSRGGLHGTSTDDIARAAGISQPYLFRLFRNKKQLFLAAVDRCFDKTIEMFLDAAATAGPDATPAERLEVMGKAYGGALKTDRERLMLQLQAYVACDDLDVRDHVRRGYERLYREVKAVSGADPDQLRAWLSTGMFLNVVAAMDLPGHGRPWVLELMGDLLKKA
jgi:AcrR family transcriptional regulator